MPCLNTLSLRETITPDDLSTIRELLTGTHKFEQAPDEIDVAVELAQIALDHNNTGEYLFFFAEENGQTVGFAC